MMPVPAPDPRQARARQTPAAPAEPEWPRFPVVKVRPGAIADKFWVDPAAIERMRGWAAEVKA